jgi:tight adherence protein C
MFEYLPLLVALLAFSSVTALALFIGQYVSSQAHLRRRLTVPVPGSRMQSGQGTTAALQDFITKHFDERRFGVDSTLRGKLRNDLIRAGFFRSDALNYYIFARVAAVIVLPSFAYVGTQFFLSRAPWFLKLGVLLISFLLAVIGPDAYLSRRQGALTTRYRQLFPDFLDLVTVCVDAGLSLDGALDRVTGEISKQSRELGLNLLMMSAETRAGRSSIEALESLAERLGLEEARSFVLVLRQSIELGSDVSETLHVFSDEMREKRLLRAEEAANKLPVKMVLPLGGFIFPVILLVVLLPIMLRLIRVVFK